MTSILREVCRERLNQEWAQADKSLDNYKNVMSKESKLIDEGEIRKNILDKAANKILALPFPEQAVFHLYYAFHFDDSQINEILMIPYAHGMRISMLNYLQKWTSIPEIFACPESISQICTISLTKLMAEINTTEDIQHVYSRRFRKQLRENPYYTTTDRSFISWNFAGCSCFSCDFSRIFNSNGHKCGISWKNFGMDRGDISEVF